MLYRSFQKNRTLWHSGLLFILLTVGAVVQGKVQIDVGGSVSTNGDRISAGDSVDIGCQSQDSQFESIQWTLNGKIISNKNVITNRESLTLTLDQLSESQNKLECSVKNEDSFRTSSYAFVYLTKGIDQPSGPSATLTLSVIEGATVTSQGGRVSLQCKLDLIEGSEDFLNPEFVWMRNANPLDLATSKNFDVKVISGKTHTFCEFFMGRINDQKINVSCRKFAKE